MKVTGLVPARFLTLISHLILVIVIFWSRVRTDMIYFFTLLLLLPGTGRTQQFEYNCQGVAQKIENGKQSESIYSELLKIKEDYDFRESVWLVEL